METNARNTMEETEAVGNKMTTEIDALKGSFAQLRHDVVDLLSHAFGIGRSGAEVARESTSDAVENLKQRLTDLKDRGASSVESIERKIEDNPLQAALIAFGVGFIMAKFFSRR